MNDSVRQEKIKEYYDEGEYFAGADQYAVWTDLLKGRLQRYRIRNLLHIYTPEIGETVVDLGCALGNISFALAPFCKEVIGIDYSKKAVELAEKMKATSPYQNIRFQVDSSDQIHLPDASVDTVFSADLFEHLYPEVYLRTLDECFRILKPGGKFVIWTPHRGHIIEILKNNNILIKADPSHVDYKSMKRIKTDLQEREFSIKRAFYRGSHNFGFNILEALFLPFIPVFRRRIAVLAEKKE